MSRDPRKVKIKLLPTSPHRPGRRCAA